VPRPLRLALALLSVTAFAACEALKAPTDPGLPAGAVRYSAVGASDAIGYGGSVVCQPFAPCPDGTGYVQTVSRRLKSAHPDFSDTNLGIPGAVVSRRLMDLGKAVGRDPVTNFIDAQMPFVPRASTLVTLFAGGNDVNIVAAAVKAGQANGNVDAYITAQISSFAQEFQELITGIRARATTTKIIVLNLPNLSRLPYANGLNPTEREWMRRLAVGYSAAMNATRSADVLIVDLMCHAPMYDAGNYSADGFHPNDVGYRRLADLVSEAIATPPGAPASACTYMN
jgi:lysophospholipase L1-like esterase